MDRSIFRIISKAGFLLVVMGFLMPFALNQNGFQVAGYLSQFLGRNAVTSSLYFMFFISCGGCILFLLLLMKKNFSIIFDWIAIILASIALMTVFSEISKVLDSITGFGNLFSFSGAGRRVGNALSEYIQSGAYMVIVGLGIALITQIIFSIGLTANVLHCPFCAEKINSEATVCQFCNKELLPDYKVISNTEIMSCNYHESFKKMKLNIGDKVYYKNIINNDPTWFYCISSDLKNEGWCFSSHFEKC